MVNFPARIPDYDSHSPALLDFFLSSDTSICSTMAFPPLGNSDHIVVSVSIDFPSNSQQDPTFHCIPCGYSCTDWDCFVITQKCSMGSLNSVLLKLLVNFVNWLRLELMYISLIISIGSSLTLLHGFQLLVLILYQQNKPSKSKAKFRPRLVIIAKGFLKLPRLHMLIKQKITSLPEIWLLGLLGNCQQFSQQR